jgi:hypothetical protein
MDGSTNCFIPESPDSDSFTTEEPQACEPATSTERVALDPARCRFCGYRAMPGDDVCFRCH